MFDEFRKDAKKAIQDKGMNYADIARISKKTKESNIKSFMCGANDSRRVAEIIADALGMALKYSNGVYVLTKDKR